VEVEEVEEEPPSSRGFTGYLRTVALPKLGLATIGGRDATSRKGVPMLWTIAVILLILWLLGMVSSYTLGGFIHILLVLAVVAILIRLIQGRSPVV
jgi:hypothetical protein